LKVSQFETLATYWFTTIQKWQETKGNVQTIKRIKYIQLCCTRYLCGQPLKTNNLGIGLNKSGLPKCLGPLQGLLINKETNELRLLLSLFKVVRTIKGSSDPDLNSIRSESHWIESFINDDEIKLVLDRFNLYVDPPLWEEPHMSTKAGPNGQALISSIKDLSLLPKQLERDLLIVGGSKFTDYFYKLKAIINIPKWIEKFPGLIRKTNWIRKLSIVRDPEAKTRLVGILDYWSQTVLKPLHDQLMDHLSRFKADCTKDQGHFEKFLSKHHGPFYSLDLSKATDSFSIGFQTKVLSFITKDDDYSKSWSRIMVDHEFNVPFVGKDYTVKYNSGQPMGAYSSWPMFTLCHHIIVQIAALRVGKKLPYNNYSLLGDDIVLTDTEVKNNYVDLIHSVGGNFSPEKSHESIDTFEFAKRWFHKGVEITAFPIRSIMETKKYAFLVSTLEAFEKRWYHKNRTLLSLGYLKEFYSLFYNKKNESSYWANKAYDYFLIPKPNDSVPTAQDKIFDLIPRLWSHCPGVYLCNQTRWPTPLQYFDVMRSQLLMVRFGLLEDGIEKCTDEYLEFKNKLDLSETFPGFPQEIADQLVPALRVSKLNLQRLIEESEQINDLVDKGPSSPYALDDVLGIRTDLAFKPDGAFQMRANEMLLVKNSKVAKRLFAIPKSMQAMKRYELLID